MQRKRLIWRGFRCFFGVLALCVVKHLHNREAVLFYVLLRAFAQSSMLFRRFSDLRREIFTRQINRLILCAFLRFFVRFALIERE